LSQAIQGDTPALTVQNQHDSGGRATAEIHPGAARVVAWMLHEGRINTHMREFGDDLSRRVVEAGIPLRREFGAGGLTFAWSLP